MCKVEFNQPSCWLLFRAKFSCILAIRNPVFRWESCKGNVWESVKNCSSVCKEAGTRGWISRVFCGCKPPDWCTRAKHARSWSVVPAVHYRKKFPGWPGRLLVAWTRDSTQSQGQAVRTPCLAKYDFSHFFSPYYIYILIPTIQRELPERILREKPLEKTRLTYPQSLPKRLFKFLYSLPLHCQILERLVTKTFSHHIHFCERVVWCFGKQLGRNQFHIGWCYGQVAEFGKLEKK